MNTDEDIDFEELSPLGRELVRGLQEVLAHVRGEPTNVRLTHYICADAKVIREHLDLSQREFSETYGIPLATLQNWEQGRNRPDKTASAYLWSIAKLPDEIKVAQESIRQETQRAEAV
jgi:putative transcriptional regulator